jgi:ArsR family metal-binding transcriptional regulator
VNFTENIKEVLPYLNANLGGFEYIIEPPSVTFKVHGKLITVHQKQIAINALKDEEEAAKIAGWMVREINEAWKNRDEIVPTTDTPKKISMPEILKNLPNTNCKECGEPTCMVFAVRLRDEIKSPSDCPYLEGEKLKALESVF